MQNADKFTNLSQTNANDVNQPPLAIASYYGGYVFCGNKMQYQFWLSITACPVGLN